MFEYLYDLIQAQLNGLVLRSYKWRRRRCLYLGRQTIQWQDPLSLHWYSENTALRLAKVRALDEFHWK